MWVGVRVGPLISTASVFNFGLNPVGGLITTTLFYSNVKKNFKNLLNKTPNFYGVVFFLSAYDAGWEPVLGELTPVLVSFAPTNSFFLNVLPFGLFFLRLVGFCMLL